MFNRFSSKGSSHRLKDNLNQEDDAIVTKSQIVGITTGGGGGTDLINVKVNPSGALTADVTGSSVTIDNGSGASAVPIKDGGNSITVDGTVTISSTPIATGLEIQKYQTNDIDKVSDTLFYVGKESSIAEWLLVKIDTTSGAALLYASITNNPSYTTYTNAWIDRSTLTYQKFSSAL